MKKIYKLAIVALSAAMIVSCGGSDSDSKRGVRPGDKAAKILPATDQGAVVNTGALAKKSGAIGNPQLKDLVADGVASGQFDEATAKHLNGIIDSPSNSGIDIDEPVYIMANDDDFDDVVVVGTVCDDDKVIKSLEVLGISESSLSEKQGFKGTRLGGGVFCFNDDTFIFSPDGDSVGDVIKGGASQGSGVVVDMLTRSDADMSVCADVSSLMKKNMRDAEIEEVKKMLDITDIDDMTADASLTFDKGEIVVKANFSEKLTNIYSGGFKPLDVSLLRYIPATEPVVVVGSLNFDNLMAMAKKVPDVGSQADMAKPFVDMLGGSMVGAAHNMNDMYCYVETKSADSASSLRALADEQMGMGSMFKIVDNSLFVASNPYRHDDFDQVKANSYANFDFGVSLKDKVLLCYLNVASPEISKLANRYGMIKFDASLIQNYIKGVVFSMNTSGNFDMKLMLQDQSQNALATIFSLALAGQLN